jgi:copper chaperone
MEKDLSTALTTTLAVTGMSCGHCVAAVTEELNVVPGVTEVSVDLVPGGISTVAVTTDGPVSRADVAAALDEAGDYHLAD